MKDLRSHWGLDPAITYLNHGGFGACPLSILERQSELRRLMESGPVEFLVRRLEPRLDEARSAVAQFVGADPAGLAFVPNATHGVAAIVGSLDLQPDDEIVVTDHGYNAVGNILDRATRKSGAVVRTVSLPLRGITPQAVVAQVTAAVGPRTRLVIVDHITSPTALVFPVADVVAALEPAIPVLVDGAHGPGMVPVDVTAIGASYYVGNCHKWLCAPKGSGFLFAAERVREMLQPPVLSHGWNSTRTDRSRFHQLFDWTGTADPTPYLAVPPAIEFMGELLPGGWDQLRTENHELALAGRDVVATALADPGALPPAEMIGAMASLPLEVPGEASPDPELLGTTLFAEHRIEVPVFAWPQPGHLMLRVSAQTYNDIADYHRLADALVAMGLGR